MNIKYYTLSALWLLFVMACGTSKNTSPDPGTSKSNSSKTEDPNPPKDLIDYLSRNSQISVFGSGNSARVSVRGMSSSSSTGEPLIVVNGTPVSGGIIAANSTVNAADIKSVRVLTTPSQISPYGIEGSSGVILIYLKY